MLSLEKGSQVENFTHVFNSTVQQNSRNCRNNFLFNFVYTTLYKNLIVNI